MKLQLAFLAASAAICQADLSLLKPVLTKMAERFTTRVTAVNNLWAGALAADTTNFDIWPLCCDSERLTEVFNANYGCVVDMAVACIRGPCTHGKLDTNRTAEMPSILGGTPTCANSALGQSFYDACMKNTKDYDGTAHQYFGSETGVFNMFPGHGVGYHCDNRATADTYDCRQRPWYLESKTALGTTQENSVQFSSPYLGFDAKVLMVTASRSVISAADSIFQGVVGLDMDMTYLLEPLADVDASEDSYAFVVDGNSNVIVAHPKLNDVPNFIEARRPVMCGDVEPETAVQDEIAKILGKPTGEFTILLHRSKTFRNFVPDNEFAPSAAIFWSAGFEKEIVEVSCSNLETSGALLKYTICAVKVLPPDMSLFKRVVAHMAERLSARVTAVNNIHSGALTADTTDFWKWPLCCDVDNEVWRSQYNAEVDLSRACIRGPCTLGNQNTDRNAAMPAVLGGTPACGNSAPGQDFYDACDQNTHHYEGFGRQYFGAETGAFTMFPAGGVGYGCANRANDDTYDCRGRPWYTGAKDALGTINENSVHFSSPYLQWGCQDHPVCIMVTAFRAVRSSDSIFQGVVGIDMEIKHLFESINFIDAQDDFYSFIIDGHNGRMLKHHKMEEVPNFLHAGKAFFYADVEPEKAIQDHIAEILGKPTGEFTINLYRDKTFRNNVPDSEHAHSAANFWSAGSVKENVEVSCINLETSGAFLKYTICAVKVYPVSTTGKNYACRRIDYEDQLGLDMLV